MKRRKRKIGFKNIPNFLIVGAARAGTTALSSYLSRHPQVYISYIKEPKFISSHFLKVPLRGRGDDFIESFTIKDVREYARLFRGVKNEAAIGEASVENLYYHDQAIPVIHDYFGDPRIIMTLRNPVDRAFSAYKMMLRDHREYLSFEDALKEEPKRMESNWEFLWFYRAVGLYYEQVKSYLENFSNVKILLFDDLQKDALKFVQGVYSFLDIDPSFEPPVNKKLNASVLARGSMYQLLFRTTALSGIIYKFLALRGISDSQMLSLVEKFRHRKSQRKHIKMNPETREKLQKHFRDDILKLQDLIGRDLSSWLTVSDSHGQSDESGDRKKIIRPSEASASAIG